MTPSRSTTTSRWGRVLRRLNSARRKWFAPGDPLALIAAIGLLLTPTLSLSAAGWPLMLGTLIPILIVSILLGFALARSQYNELFALLVSLFAGGSAVFLLTAINEPGDLWQGIISMLERISLWIGDAVSGGINQDEMVFTILVALLFWLLGYNAAWHMFRIDRVWRVILPPGLILIFNSVFYTGTTNLDVYLIAFLFLSLLLIVRSNLDAREWDWYVNGIRVPSSLRGQVFRVGTVLALVVLIVAWAVPRGDIQERLNGFQAFLQQEPLQQLAELWSRLFANVDAQGPATSDYYGGDSLRLGGPIRLGQEVVFWVGAPQDHRYYWRSRVLDVYEGGRWTPAALRRLTSPNPIDIPQSENTGAAREAVDQVFTMGLNASRLVYAAPQVSSVTIPSVIDLRYTPTNEMNISVVRPQQVLYRGDVYAVTSLVSVATADDLRGAAAQYPAWITDLYLYVSPSVTPRTIELARQIVANAGAVTPYDQAKAIETWLRLNIRYNESIPQPPVGVDPVDWVLFDLREGYCNYYASAMIVMLRSLGIPARLAAGFSQGTYDPSQGVYVVRERDAHTWVEVYFPGYGWIEFEPTSGQPPLNRPGDQQQQNDQPTSTPPPSPTPTLTPTPTITPTSDGSPTPPPAALVMPTNTPTPTPTPTATPVVVPTQPPPALPQPRTLLSFLLPALGAALLIVLLIALLVAVGTFIYWWWEWRGMRGLSPVTRAYARLERYLPLIGIRPTAQQTPEERRRRVAKELPAAEPPVTAITRMYSVERYGKAQRAPYSETADAAWTDARTSILECWVRKLLRLPIKDKPRGKKGG